MLKGLSIQLLCGAAVAAISSAPAAAAEKSFNIASQPLPAALREFGMQSGATIVFSASTTGVRIAPAVVGHFEPQQALDRILAGTSLTYLRNGAAFTVVPATKTAQAPTQVIRVAMQQPQPRAAAAPADIGGVSASPSSIEEVVVTATRTAQNLSKVPLSVSAYGQAKLDSQGVKDIRDVARLTPGIQFNQGGNNTNNISIRGISSTAGASTTGIYIDDTPIQVRSIGYASANVFPTIFDLERVEVLRGPQGTLFGAGSEGGTIRFIQPAPSLTRYSSYARAEAAKLEHGTGNYEAGLAVGGPIIQDKLAFRVSGFYRMDGGYIDKIAGTATVVDRLGTLGPRSVQFVPTGITAADTNYFQTYAARAALTWAVTPDLLITPSVSFQKQKFHDAIQSMWASTSDFESGRFQTPQWLATTDATRIPLSAPYNEPAMDRFLLPSIHVDWDLGPVQFVSNTAYFDRYSTQTLDVTLSYERDYIGRPVPIAGDRAVSPHANRQQVYTQEFRLQSNTDSRLTWIAGVYLSKALQKSQQAIDINFFTLTPTYAGVPANGAPFGPGFTSFQNYYGIDALPNGRTYYTYFRTQERQVAGFAQADFAITPELKLTAGVRVSNNKLTYSARYRGPENNLNAPVGVSPCQPGTSGATCPRVPVGAFGLGQGPFAPVYGDGAEATSENATTPKVGLSWQATPQHLVYASASKGFRPGGAQLRLSSDCNNELVQLGYTDSNGRAASPLSFKSDSVWSYEAGSKNRLFGGRLQLDASAFYIDWKNIQSSVSVASCQLSFIGNLGNAVSKGFDLQAQWEPVDNLNLGLAVGHTRASFSQATVTASGQTLFTKGSSIPNAGAPWTYTLTAQYDFAFADHDFYARGDYTYQSRFRVTGQTDPGVTRFDAYQRPREAFGQLNLRAGIKLGDADVSLFAVNATDASPHLGYTRSRNQPVYTDFTIRPRTVGITVSYRR